MRIPFLALTATLAACASVDESDRFDPTDDPRVGAEQQTLCFSRNINAFAEYGDNDDDGILLRRGANTWYLVTFAGPCPNLGFTRAVGLGPDLTGAGCIRRSDRLWVSDGTRSNVGMGSNACLIDRIYAFDRNATAPTEESDAE
ncbi:MAG: DUF6491 family protein [Pseudomonadota bacterium]